MFCAFVSAYAGVQPFLLHDRLSEQGVGREYGTYLVDSSKNLTVAQVSKMHPSKFRQYTSSYLVDSSSEVVYWLRFQIKSTTDRSYIMEFFDFDLEDVAFYLEREQGVFEVQYAGYSRPFEQRYLPHKNLTFSLCVPKGETRTIFLRFVSSQSNVLQPIVRSTQRFVDYSIHEYIFLGILYGLLALVVFYNNLYFLFLRKSHFGYYSLFVLGILVYLMASNGTGFQFVWSNYPAFNAHAVTLSLFLVVTCILLYTHRILADKNTVLWSRFLKIVVLIRCLVFIIELKYPRYTGWETVDLAFLQIPLCMSLLLMRKGAKNAKWFAIAYVLFDLSFVITYLEHQNVLESNVFTVYALSFGTVLQFVLLSFNYGENIKRAFAIKNEAQAELIAQYKRNEYLQASINRELEVKVAERTKELETQNREMERQKEEIQALNENLESLVRLRTSELEDRNNRIREYAFSNSHLVRGPLARILGLAYLAQHNPECVPDFPAMVHDHAHDLDAVIKEMTKILEEN